MRSVALLKATYAATSILFTCLLVSMLRAALARSPDEEWVALTLAPRLGVAALLVALLGWVVGRRLGLSWKNAGAVALGSVMGGINVAVFVWVLQRAPSRPPAG